MNALRCFQRVLLLAGVVLAAVGVPAQEGAEPLPERPGLVRTTLGPGASVTALPSPRAGDSAIAVRLPAGALAEGPEGCGVSLALAQNLQRSASAEAETRRAVVQASVRVSVDSLDIVLRLDPQAEDWLAEAGGVIERLLTGPIGPDQALPETRRGRLEDDAEAIRLVAAVAAELSPNTPRAAEFTACWSRPLPEHEPEAISAFRSSAVGGARIALVTAGDPADDAAALTDRLHAIDFSIPADPAQPIPIADGAVASRTGPLPPGSELIDIYISTPEVSLRTADDYESLVVSALAGRALSEALASSLGETGVGVTGEPGFGRHPAFGSVLTIRIARAQQTDRTARHALETVRSLADHMPDEQQLARERDRVILRASAAARAGRGVSAAQLARTMLEAESGGQRLPALDRLPELTANALASVSDDELADVMRELVAESPLAAVVTVPRPPMAPTAHTAPPLRSGVPDRRMPEAPAADRTGARSPADRELPLVLDDVAREGLTAADEPDTAPALGDHVRRVVYRPATGEIRLLLTGEPEREIVFRPGPVEADQADLSPQRDALGDVKLTGILADFLLHDIDAEVMHQAVEDSEYRMLALRIDADKSAVPPVFAQLAVVDERSEPVVLYDQSNSHASLGGLSGGEGDLDRSTVQFEPVSEKTPLTFYNFLDPSGTARALPTNTHALANITTGEFEFVADLISARSSVREAPPPIVVRGDPDEAFELLIRALEEAVRPGE